MSAFITIIALALAYISWLWLHPYVRAWLDARQCTYVGPPTGLMTERPHAMRSMSLQDYILNTKTNNLVRLTYANTKSTRPVARIIYGTCPSNSKAVAISLDDKYMTLKADASVGFDDVLRDPQGCWIKTSPGVCGQPDYDMFASAAYPGRFLNHTDVMDKARLTVAMDRYDGAKTKSDYCWTRF